MEADFWLQRWANNEIGFHIAEANPLLVAYIDSLDLVDNSKIFLPLCGKTLDIGWLLSQGYRVAGAELSQSAVEQLFADLNIVPEISQQGELKRYSTQQLDIFVGDIFKLSQAQLGEIDAVYDRAALVALPEAMRLDYSTHLKTLCPKASQLLITLDYDQQLASGPPFAINQQEVEKHYSTDYEIQLLASEDVEGGLKGKYPAIEQVWLLKNNAV